MPVASVLMESQELRTFLILSQLVLWMGLLDRAAIRKEIKLHPFFTNIDDATFVTFRLRTGVAGSGIVCDEAAGASSLTICLSIVAGTLH